MKRGGEKEEGWIGEKVCLRMGAARAGEREGRGKCAKSGKNRGSCETRFFDIIKSRKMKGWGWGRGGGNDVDLPLSNQVQE